MQDNPDFNVNDEFGASIKVCADPTDPTCQTRVILRQPTTFINYEQIPVLEAVEVAISSSYATSASNVSSISYENVLNKPTLVSSSTQIQLQNISGSTFSDNDFTFPQNVSAQGVKLVNIVNEPSGGLVNTTLLYSTDRSAGNTIPSIYCEGTGVVDAGITNTTVTHKIALKINGVVYYLLATTDAT